MNLPRLLKTLFWLTMCYLVSISSINATELQSQAQSHQHGRFGSHGMVLLTDGEQLFASHLPLYRRPHDMQIIYRINAGVAQEALINLAQNSMVTLLPENFNLDLLISGKDITLNTQFYRDHFERGGAKWHQPISVAFQEAKYLRSLINLATDDSVKLTHYQIKPISNTQHYLLIREIEAAPSVDHILVIAAKADAKCPQSSTEALSFNWTAYTLAQQRQRLVTHITPCFQVINEYWETADFAK